MEPYQERVVLEKTELDERINRLTKFWKGVVFLTLPQAEQDRLRRQMVLMEDYSAVLAERIAAF